MTNDKDQKKDIYRTDQLKPIKELLQIDQFHEKYNLWSDYFVLSFNISPNNIHIQF